MPKSPDRVILFTSYGSPNGVVSVEGTPMIVSECKQVSLRPVNHKDGIPQAGLLLMKDEFDDMVERLHPENRFEADFLEYVFHVTAGHTGAVSDLLQVASAHEVSLRIQIQHSLTIVSRHTANSRMTAGSTRWKCFRAYFLSRYSGRVFGRAVYSDVGSQCLLTSENRLSLEFSVQCSATIM